jgi:putative endonuclease
MSYIVYLLINTSHNKTYVGITNNPSRRIRQHNKELVGGAKYTTNNKGEGQWKYYGYIENIPKNLALKLEKYIKCTSRKYSGTPIERRLKAINKIIEDKNIIFKIV